MSECGSSLFFFAETPADIQGRPAAILRRSASAKPDVDVQRLRKVGPAKPRALFVGKRLHQVEREFASRSDWILSQETRPKTRGDCVGGQRPCPWVGCKWHLAIDVNEAGSLKINFPATNATDDLTDEYIDWDSMKETCSLDVVDKSNGLLPSEIGQLLNCVESNIQRIEHDYLTKLREEIGNDMTMDDFT